MFHISLNNTMAAEVGLQNIEFRLIFQNVEVKAKSGKVTHSVGREGAKKHRGVCLSRPNADCLNSTFIIQALAAQRQREEALRPLPQTAAVTPKSPPGRGPGEPSRTYLGDTCADAWFQDHKRPGACIRSNHK